VVGTPLGGHGMIELGGDCFDDVCRDPSVREQLGSLETNRSAAVRRFWTWLLLSIALAIAAAVSLTRAGWVPLSFIVPILFLALGATMAFRALSKVSEGLKQPVLAAIAAKAGLD
jgi:membrane protein YqaA with SNARE-associated domain